MDASDTLEQRVLEIQKLPRGSNKRRRKSANLRHSEIRQAILSGEI